MLVAMWPPILALTLPLARRRRRAAWVLMALGVATMAAGATFEILLRINAVVRPEDASLSDPVFVVGYALFWVGTWQLVRRHGGREVREGLIDGAVMLVAPTVLLVQFVLTSSGVYFGSPWLRLDAAVYPFMDLIVLATLVWLLATPALTRAHMGLIVAGFSVLLVLDTGLAMEMIRSGSKLRALFECLYPLAYALIAAGVAIGATTRLGRPSQDPIMHWGRVGLLAFGAIVAPTTVLLAAVGPRPLPLDWIATAALFTAVVIVVRMLDLARVLGRVTRELSDARSELEVQATRDPLTGLWNRALLDDFLHTLHDPAARPAALVSIDLDRFKEVNDEHGHAAGDAVLEAVASRMRAAVRTEDVVLRMGGDEFLVVLRNVEPEEVDSLARRLVDALAQPVPWQGHGLRVSASAGVALLSAESHPDLSGDPVARADAAMYEAKRSGPGQVRTVSGDRREHEERRRELPSAP